MAEDLLGILGQVVAGTFLVEQVVSQGEHGLVYRAHHRGFRTRVALKCLGLTAPWEGPARDRLLEAFRAGAEQQMRLAAVTPVFVRPIQVGSFIAPEGQEVPFLALEWLDGWSLDAIIAQRRAQQRPPISLRKLVRMLTPVARALEQAHALRSPNGAPTAHGDLTPSNLFVAFIGGEQVVKILDYGLSNLRSVSGGSASRAAGPRSAPERWFPDRYGAVGAWTDVWGLALTLVEAMKGREVTGGSGKLAAAFVDPIQGPTPQSQGLRVSDGVEAVFRKALALDPRARYRSMHAFWEELLEVLDLDATGQPKWSRRPDPRAEGVKATPSQIERLRPTQLSGLPPPRHTVPPPSSSSPPRWQPPPDLDALEFEPPRAPDWPVLPPPFALGSSPPAPSSAPASGLPPAPASSLPPASASGLSSAPPTADDQVSSVPALEIPSAPAVPFDLAPEELPSGPLAAVALDRGEAPLQLDDPELERRSRPPARPTTSRPAPSLRPPSSSPPAAPRPAGEEVDRARASGRPSGSLRAAAPLGRPGSFGPPAGASVSIPVHAPEPRRSSVPPRSALSSYPPPPGGFASTAPTVSSVPPRFRSEPPAAAPARNVPVIWSRLLPAVLLLLIAVGIAVLNQRHGGVSGGESLYLGPLRATWISLGFFVAAVGLAIAALRRPFG